MTRGPNHSHQTGWLDDFWVFDVTAIVWARVSASGAGAPSSRKGLGLAWASGALYLYGGTFEGAGLSDMFLFNATTLVWTELTGVSGPPPIARSDFGFVALGESLYLFGGKGPPDVYIPEKAASCANDALHLSRDWCARRNDLHKFHVASREWTQIEPQGLGENWPPPRQGAFLAAGDDGMLFLFGGDVGTEQKITNGQSSKGWSGRSLVLTCSIARFGIVAWFPHFFESGLKWLAPSHTLLLPLPVHSTPTLRPPLPPIPTLHHLHIVFTLLSLRILSHTLSRFVVYVQLSIPFTGLTFFMRHGHRFHAGIIHPVREDTGGSCQGMGSFSYLEERTSQEVIRCFPPYSSKEGQRACSVHL